MKRIVSLRFLRFEYSLILFNWITIFFVKQLRNSALKYDFVVVVRIELIPKRKIKEYSQSREIVCYEEKYIADNPTNTV